MKLDTLLPSGLSEQQVFTYGKLGDFTVELMLVFATLFSLALYFVANRWKNRNLPPGPWNVPFVGSLGTFDDNFYKKCMNWRKTYGDVQSYYYGSRLVVVVNGFDLIHETLVKRALDFADRPLMNPPFVAEYGDELFFAEYNEVWKQNKKFAVKALKSFGAGSASLEAKIQVEIERLADRFRDMKGKPMPIQQMIENALARVITSIICSKDFGDNDKEVEDLVQTAADWFGCFLIIPPKYWTTLPSFLRKLVYPEYYALTQDKRFKGLKQFVTERIKEHQKTIDPSNPRDVADVYLNAREGPDMDMNMLANTLLMLTPDGIDSLGCTMTLSIMYLTKYQEVQKKIQEELDRVVGRDYMPTTEHKKDLVYLEAALLECQRVSTVFPLSAAHKPLYENLTINGYRVPRDSMVFPNLYSVHMDTTTFPNPEKFDPGHFLNENGEVVNANHCMIFSVGRRMCMGDQLAKLELFMYFAALLHQFSFSFPEGEDEPSIEPEIIGGITGMTMRRPVIFNLCATPR